MSKRTKILSALVSHISLLTNSSGHRGLKFLHEVNSFPSFYIHPQNESRVHYGAGSAFGVVNCSIRGFQWSDTIDNIEMYARSIEAAIQTFREQYSNLVEEARVTSIRTDEGVMAPYGIVDMNLDILYTVDYRAGITADSTIITADNNILTIDGGL